MTPKHLVRSKTRPEVEIVRAEGPEPDATTARRPEAGKDVARALDEVIDETRALFHRLRAAASEVHGGGALAGGQRGVLRELLHSGPLTVPQMARSRPVSRQHIQTLVNGLAADGLVERVDNPAHKRSRLVRLTPAGENTIRSMMDREAGILAQLGSGLDARDLRRTASVLRDVRRRFEDPVWPPLPEKAARSPERRSGRRSS